MKATESGIINQDMFGHVINLNFDRKGDSHKTLCGGVFSIALKGFLSFYVILLLIKLISKGNDTNLSTEGLLHLEDLGAVNYDFQSMHMKFFHVIRKQDKE